MSTNVVRGVSALRTYLHACGGALVSFILRMEVRVYVCVWKERSSIKLAFGHAHDFVSAELIVAFIHGLRQNVGLPGRLCMHDEAACLQICVAVEHCFE